MRCKATPARRPEQYSDMQTKLTQALHAVLKAVHVIALSTALRKLKILARCQIYLAQVTGDSSSHEDLNASEVSGWAQYKNARVLTGDAKLDPALVVL
jgi:hypothetical protein